MSTQPLRTAQTAATSRVAEHAFVDLPRTAAAPIFEAHKLCVSYGPRRAVDGVSLSLRPGEVVALLGENGAGKSTLLHAIYGLVQLESGEVRYQGETVAPSPEHAIERGLGLVLQHFALIPALSVAENVVLGREPRRPGFFGGLFFDHGRAIAEVEALALRCGLPVDPRRKVAELGVGEAQRVAILQTLYRGARGLLLDEPTAVLTPVEAARLLRVLRELLEKPTPSDTAAAQKHGLILVTHKLDEVLEVADRALVLRGGRLVEEVPRAAFSARELAHALVGRTLVPVVRSPSSVPDSAPALVVRDLWVQHEGVARVRGVSLAVKPGTIFGIAGVEGNGQSELVSALCGWLPASRGSIEIAGHDLTSGSVRKRLAAGLSVIPEDRHRHGLILDLSIVENLLLGPNERTRGGALIEHGRLTREAEILIRDYDVRPPDPSLPARALSGGNQQKVVLGRALKGTGDKLPTLLIAAQPTRGVDIGAIDRIHRALLAARDSGCAILLLSAELDELRALSDRIAVLYRGAVVAELENPESDPVSREKLGELLTGAA